MGWDLLARCVGRDLLCHPRYSFLACGGRPGNIDPPVSTQQHMADRTEQGPGGLQPVVCRVNGEHISCFETAAKGSPTRGEEGLSNPGGPGEVQVARTAGECIMTTAQRADAVRIGMLYPEELR